MIPRGRHGGMKLRRSWRRFRIGMLGGCSVEMRWRGFIAVLSESLPDDDGVICTQQWVKSPYIGWDCTQIGGSTWWSFSSALLKEVVSHPQDFVGSKCWRYFLGCAEFLGVEKRRWDWRFLSKTLKSINFRSMSMQFRYDLRDEMRKCNTWCTSYPISPGERDSEFASQVTNMIRMIRNKTTSPFETSLIAFRISLILRTFGQRFLVPLKAKI